jgi:hypothetical protein
MRGYHAWISMNPLSLLKLSGCNQISMASFIKLSVYPALLERMVVSSKSILWQSYMQCSATADFSGWFSGTYMYVLHIIPLIMDAELVSETFCFYPQLTRLFVREDFIEKKSPSWNSPPSIEPEGSLTCLEVFATGSSPELLESIPQPRTFRSVLIVPLYVRVCLQVFQLKC